MYPAYLLDVCSCCAAAAHMLGRAAVQGSQWFRARRSPACMLPHSPLACSTLCNTYRAGSRGGGARKRMLSWRHECALSWRQPVVPHPPLLPPSRPQPPSPLPPQRLPLWWQRQPMRRRLAAAAPPPPLLLLLPQRLRRDPALPRLPPLQRRRRQQLTAARPRRRSRQRRRRH